MTERQYADPVRHSHGEGAAHAHARGDEEHTHLGRRANDGSIVWMTLWPDGSEEARRLNDGGAA